MPKLTPFEVSKLQDFDMALQGDGRNEMSVERQWGTLAMMDLLKMEPETGEGEWKMTTAATTRPNPPPPRPPTTFARDPRRSSQSLLGGKITNGKTPKEIPKEEIPKGGAKGKITKEIAKEKVPKEKTPKGRIQKDGRV